MDISIRDLRAKTKEIIDSVNRGVPVTLRSHKRACARIVPVKPQRKSAPADPAFGMWKDHKEMVNVSKYVKNLRKGRSL